MNIKTKIEWWRIAITVETEQYPLKVRGELRRTSGSFDVAIMGYGVVRVNLKFSNSFGLLDARLDKDTNDQEALDFLNFVKNEVLPQLDLHQLFIEYIDVNVKIHENRKKYEEKEIIALQKSRDYILRSQKKKNLEG